MIYRVYLENDWFCIVEKEFNYLKHARVYANKRRKELRNEKDFRIVIQKEYKEEQ